MDWKANAIALEEEKEEYKVTHRWIRIELHRANNSNMASLPSSSSSFLAHIGD